MLRIDLGAFAACAGWDRLPPEVADLGLQATADDPRFPGALLPVVTEGGNVFWYGVAPDSATWRRLRPLLLAYAGPTITSFSGVPKRFDRSQEPERLLAEAGAFTIAALVPPENGVPLTSRALRRLVDGLARAPSEPPQPPMATSVLLARFDMSLAAGDRVGAEAALFQMQEEWRLDVLNLRFAEVRLLAAFRDWAGLASQPWFDDLCRVSQPAPVAQAMLEALWQTHLAPAADDEDELHRRYVADVRPVCLDLLAEVAPAAEGPSALLAALEAAHLGTDAASVPTHPHVATRAHGWGGVGGCGGSRGPVRRSRLRARGL